LSRSLETGCLSGSFKDCSHLAKKSSASLPVSTGADLIGVAIIIHLLYLLCKDKQKKSLLRWFVKGVYDKMPLITNLLLYK
jgi:hypothetical protein